MAGLVTVGQVEFADYPTKILEKHWPDVPRWRDIRDLTKESFYARTGLRTVDVISGGFPCQPFSVAGERRGKEDDRYLWPEMLRVISELRPSWVVGENVPNIVNLALDEVLSDLENEGYESQCFIIPACGVDAPHKRNRIAIIGHDKNGTIRDGKTLADTESRWEPGEQSSRGKTWRFGGGGWWPIEPGVGRVVNGVPNRVDRIKCLGNAVVPQQFYPFFRAIYIVEGGLINDHCDPH